MGKPRMTALAIAIKAAELLSDEEKQTLRDVLRPAPKPRQKVTLARCKHCNKPSNAAVHNAGSSRYEHDFETLIRVKTAQKRKAGKDNGDDNPPFAGLVCAACGKPFGDNDHHLESRPTYHPFQSADEAKAATGGGQ